MSSSPDGDVPVGCETYHFLASRVDVVLSEAARKALDMATQIEKLFNEAHRRVYDRGKAERETEWPSSSRQSVVVI